MKNIFLSLITLTTFFLTTSCGPTVFSNGAIGKTYQFNCDTLKLECYECDSRWFINVLSETDAQIYSSTSSSSLKSCSTKIKYNFDSTDGSIIIKEMENRNVNSDCRANFTGTFTFDEEGSSGKGFYKKNGCKFL